MGTRLLETKRLRGARIAFLALVVCVSFRLAAPVPASADDNSVPPNPPFAVSPQAGVGHQYQAPYQWWRVHLNKGDSISATLTVTSEADDDVYLDLYPPGTTHGTQRAVAPGRPVRSFTYVADRSGDFLFRVFTFDAYSSSYVITFVVTPAPPKTAPDLLSTPSVPKSVSRSAPFTVFGYLKPRHAPGYVVRVYRWKRISATRWKPYGYVKAPVSDYSTYSKYSVRLRLSERGVWKFRAYAPADDDHLAHWSGTSRYVTVR